MTAREEILARIGTVVGSAPPPRPEVPREYVRHETLPSSELLELLSDRLRDYEARVVHCTAEELPRAVAAAVDGARRIGVPPGLDRGWAAECAAEVVTDSPETPFVELDRLDAVVTSSAVTCARTGTIFLDGQPDQGRRALTLVPDKHVCVVDLSTVMVGVPDAVAALHPERPTTLVSGPSATSDIELERVEGVHGPRTLVVIVRTDR